MGLCLEFAVRVGGAVLGVCRESGWDIEILCLVFTVSVKEYRKRVLGVLE